MASRFWVGGTGNWDDATTTNWAATTGGTGGVSVPGASDDVTFDNLSNATAYTVTITGNSVSCKNLTIGAPASGAVTLAGSKSMNIAGNLNLSGGVAGITNNFTGLLQLTQASGTATITTNSVALKSSVQFLGTSSTFQLADDLTTSGVNLQTGSGTFNPNGKTVTCTGASLTITVGSSGFSFFNLTYTPSSPAKTNTLTISSGNIAVTNLFTVSNGATVTNRILIASNTVGTPRTITSASNSLANVDLQDITGAGAASWNLAAITGLSGDCGGNSGITFTTPADQHWVKAAGAGGNWSGGATNWTSRTPLPQDNVFFDFAFGTSQTVTADMPRLGKNIDFTGATWTTALTWSISVSYAQYGSLTLISNLTLSGIPQSDFRSRTSSTITTNGVTISFQMNIIAFGGSYQLQDDLNVASTQIIRIDGGTLDANNHNVSAAALSTNNTFTGSILMGNGTWTLNGNPAIVGDPWRLTSSSNISVTCGSSTIKITNSGNTAINFAGGGKTYNNVWFSRGVSTGSITITGSNVFNDFKDDGTVAHSLLFTAGTTTTVTTFSVNGSSGNLITISSVTTGTHSLVKAGGGTISCDYLIIQHSVATPTLTWYAGANSTNSQGTATAGSGWIFTAPPIAYTITCTQGSYSTTGETTLFQRGIKILLTQGSYALTGIAVLLKNGIAFVLTTGSYTLTGISTVFSRGIGMIVATGIYTLTGISTSFSRTISMTVSAGSYTLTGINVTLLYFKKAINKYFGKDY